MASEPLTNGKTGLNHRNCQVHHKKLHPRVNRSRFRKMFEGIQILSKS